MGNVGHVSTGPEFERNDPMAIFEEEDLVVDKGMTHVWDAW